MTSDGCTGFWWAEWLSPTIRDCCIDHDLGGSGGSLLDCLQQSLPPWAWAIAAFCVTGMIFVRPIYRTMKRLFSR